MPLKAVRFVGCGVCVLGCNLFFVFAGPYPLDSRTVHIHLPDGSVLEDRGVPLTKEVEDWIATARLDFVCRGGILKCGHTVLHRGTFADIPPGDIHFINATAPKHGNAFV